MRCALFLVVAAACGRVHFDPLGNGDDGDGGNGDGGGSNGDGGMGDGGGSVDAMLAMLAPGGETCASAATLSFGTSGTGSIAGATNDFSALCGNGIELVWRVTVPTTSNHRLYLRPSFNAVLSIANACPPAGGSCQTVIANQTYDNTPQFQAGTMYVIIDRSGGTGTSFDFILE